MDVMKLYEIAKEAVVKAKAAVPSYAAEEGAEMAVIVDSKGKTYAAMTAIIVKDGAVVRVPAAAAAFLNMKNTGVTVATCFIVLSMADRRIMPPAPEVLDLMYAENRENDNCIAILSAYEQKHVSAIRLTHDNGFVEGFDFAGKEEEEPMEAPLPKIVKRPKPKTIVAPEDVPDEAKLKIGDLGKKEENVIPTLRKPEPQKPEVKAAEPKKPEIKKPEPKKPEPPKPEPKKVEQKKPEPKPEPVPEKAPEPPKPTVFKSESSAPKDSGPANTISGVKIDESNPFYEAPTKAKPVEEVVAIVAEGDEIESFADANIDEDLPELSKEELLKQAKKRKKVARANFLFRKKQE